MLLLRQRLLPVVCGARLAAVGLLHPAYQALNQVSIGRPSVVCIKRLLPSCGGISSVSAVCFSSGTFAQVRSEAEEEEQVVSHDGYARHHQPGVVTAPLHLWSLILNYLYFLIASLADLMADNRIVRATGSLGDVLGASLRPSATQIQEDRRLNKAKSILSRMGTIYSVYSGQRGHNLQNEARTKV